MIKNPCCNEIGLKNKRLTINILTTLFRDLLEINRGGFFYDQHLNYLET